MHPHSRPTHYMVRVYILYCATHNMMQGCTRVYILLCDPLYNARMYYNVSTPSTKTKLTMHPYIRCVRILQCDPLGGAAGQPFIRYIVQEILNPCETKLHSIVHANLLQLGSRMQLTRYCHTCDLSVLVHRRTLGL